MEWSILNNGDIQLTRRSNTGKVTILFNSDKKVDYNPQDRPILKGQQWAVFVQ